MKPLTLQPDDLDGMSMTDAIETIEDAYTAPGEAEMPEGEENGAIEPDALNGMAAAMIAASFINPILERAKIDPYSQEETVMVGNGLQGVLDLYPSISASPATIAWTGLVMALGVTAGPRYMKFKAMKADAVENSQTENRTPPNPEHDTGVEI